MCLFRDIYHLFQSVAYIHNKTFCSAILVKIPLQIVCIIISSIRHDIKASKTVKKLVLLKGLTMYLLKLFFMTQQQNCSCL